MSTTSRSTTLDYCTLVWPDLSSQVALRSSVDSNKKQTLPPASSTTQWLVGWNPRGLVVVAASLLEAATCDDASTLLYSMRHDIEDVVAAGAFSPCDGRPARRSCDEFSPQTREQARLVARGLRVLGRVRVGDIKSTEDSSDTSLRQLRQHSDIWLELSLPPAAAGSSSRAPTLTELYCCGYKVPQFHLHLVHCLSRYMQQSPMVFSVLAHYGFAGVKALVGSAGFEPALPTTLPASESAYEGKILPKHVQSLLRGSATHNGFELLRLTSLSGAQRGQGATESSPTTTPAPSPMKLPPTKGSDAPVSGPPKLQLGDSFSNDGSDALGKTQSTLETSLSDATDTIAIAKPFASASSSAAPPANRPPRLDFPERSDMTELSCWLLLCNSGTCIRSMQAKRRDGAVSRRQPLSHPAVWAIVLKVLSLFLPLVSAVAHVSYVARMVEYRLREVINWTAMMGGLSHSCGLHPLMPHALDPRCSESSRRLCMRGFLWRALTDVVLGVFLCFVLLSYRSLVTAVVQRFAWFGLYDLHVGYLDWFRGWPAGFKMNDDLNDAISTFNLSILYRFSELLSMASVDWIPLSYDMLVCIAPLGASFALCFVSDCCNMVTQHLRMMFHLMEAVYRSFLALLACLLAQFRGLKHNPLRKRADAFEFGIDQMLLGTLLFTATLFLFPTVALYYFYLALVRTSVWVVQEALLAVAFACSNVPLYAVWVWLRHAHQYPSGVVLTDAKVRGAQTPLSSTKASPSTPPVAGATPTAANMSPGTNSSAVVVEMSLTTQPMPLSTALFDFTVLIWILRRPFTIPNILRFIVLGEERPCVNGHVTLFPHLKRNAAVPELPAVKAK